MSEAEAPGDSSLTAAQADAKRRKGLSLDELADSSKSVRLRSRRLSYMGRALTKEIVEFIDVKLPVDDGDDEFYFLGPGETFPLEDATAVEEVGLYGFRYITGPPGTGKSTSLEMAVLYLSARYASEQPVRRRIVLVDGTRFATDPHWTLLSALRRAGVTVEPQMDVFTFLMSSEEVRYTIVVDDGNKISPSSPAAGLLASLVKPCVVVFCASVSSEWTDVIRKPKTYHYKLVTKGLEGEELKQFCKIYGIEGKHLNMGETGTNPRLMVLFKRDMAEFEKAIFRLEVEATEFLKQAVEKGDRDHVLAAMAGTATRLLPLDPMLDSKCFYVAEDRSLECITDGLRAFCSVKLMELIKEADIDRQCELIGALTHAISKDSNTIRIGWNAEDAALLALKFLQLNIYYATDKSFHTGGDCAFEIFEGQMSADKLSSERIPKKVPRVYAPKNFNHMGLDFYLELEDSLVAFQVSVALHAEARHPRTVETAEELFRAAGKLVNVLIYVIPGGLDSFSSEQVESVQYAGLTYYYVKMPFVSLCSRLQPIDKRLEEIRGSSAWRAEDVCWKCQKRHGDPEWVQCDVCLLWYHQGCVGYDPTPKPAILERRPRQLPTPGREFECEACRDFVRRKGWQSKANEHRKRRT